MVQTLLLHVPSFCFHCFLIQSAGVDELFRKVCKECANGVKPEDIRLVFGGLANNNFSRTFLQTFVVLELLFSSSRGLADMHLSPCPITVDT